MTDKKNLKIFTNIIDLDIEIINHLKDSDLENVFLINKYTYNNDNLLKRRIQKYFCISSVCSGSRYIKYKKEIRNNNVDPLNIRFNCDLAVCEANESENNI